MITLVVSCGRNIEADVNTINDLIEKLDKTRFSIEEDTTEILLNYKTQSEIYSYYINDANYNEFDSFVTLMNKTGDGEGIKNKEDLEAILNALNKLTEIYEQGMSYFDNRQAEDKSNDDELE
jgi:hypothetical protein